MPPARGELPNAVVISRARYTAPADRSRRFYREYFAPDHVVEIEKQRRRWRILYGGEDFAVNLDTIAAGPAEGMYLEIKSRSWSARDAEEKAALIGEMLALCGISEANLVKQEYVDLALSQ